MQARCQRDMTEEGAARRASCAAQQTMAYAYRLVLSPSPLKARSQVKEFLSYYCHLSFKLLFMYSLLPSQITLATTQQQFTHMQYPTHIQPCIISDGVGLVCASYVRLVGVMLNHLCRNVMDIRL